jgi:hypothetical protein
VSRLRAGLLYNLIRLFRIKAESERVARGFALGLIVNFFPTFGFGVLISGFFARLFGGNAAAGLVGGALLTFFWPVLFYLNVRTGSWVISARAPIEEVAQVTEGAVNALVWGRAFTFGAIYNSLIVGLTAYLVLRLVYHQIRPTALAYFRRHALQRPARCRVPKILPAAS